MKTFILMWNPSISSYTWERFKDDQKEMCESGWGEGVGNWSVWEHEKAEEGDRFFMVKVGHGMTGIVMAGYFYGDPYEDEDWSGRGRQTYYIDLNITQQIDPDKIDIITTETLMAEIPNFDWTGGHSGRLLDSESAEKLELLWLRYYNKIRLCKKEDAVYIDHYSSFNNDIINNYFRRTRGETCDICGYNYKKVFGDDCELFLHHRLCLPDSVAEKPLTDEQFLNYFKCICPNCDAVSEEVIYRKLHL